MHTRKMERPSGDHRAALDRVARLRQGMAVVTLFGRRLNRRRLEHALWLMTVPEVQGLSQRAVVEGRSARGRLGWLSENEDDVRTAVLSVAGQESEGVSRCIVTTVMETGELRYFSLDVADHVLNRLPVLRRPQLLEVARVLLGSARHVRTDE
jgi:hypothetical protein